MDELLPMYYPPTKPPGGTVQQAKLHPPPPPLTNKYVVADVSTESPEGTVMKADLPLIKQYNESTSFDKYFSQKYGLKTKLNIRKGERPGLLIAREYCTSVLELAPQLEFLKNIWEGVNPDTKHKDSYTEQVKLAISDYITQSHAIQVAATTGRTDIRIDLIDAAFKHIPPITKPITIYRVYNTGGIQSAEGELNRSSRYLSTSLSQTFVDKCFSDHSPTSINVRIDIMPGMKILPVMNYEKWGKYADTSTQFEILLPRNAGLYDPELGRNAAAECDQIPEFEVNNSAIPLITGLGPRNTVELPTIDYHFIVAPQGFGEFIYNIESHRGIQCHIDGGGGGSKPTKMLSFNTADDKDIQTPLSDKILNIIINKKSISGKSASKRGGKSASKHGSKSASKRGGKSANKRGGKSVSKRGGKSVSKRNRGRKIYK